MTSPVRRAAILLALVLSLSLGGSAAANSPKQARLPSVQSDPVLVVTAQGPGPGEVKSDPVQMPSPRVSEYTGFVLVVTAGPGLSGTYVGTDPVRYIPAFQYQLIYGDPLGGYNCTAYSMAMAIDKATYGGTRVTGKQVRALTGVTVSASHIGLSIPDVIVASDKLKVPITNMSGGDWDDVMAALRAGRGVLLQGLYSAIPDRYSGQIGFTGAHAIFIDHLSSTGRLYMMDPLQKVGARWMDASTMRAFAEALGRREGIYPRVFYAVTRHTRLFN